MSIRKLLSAALLAAAAMATSTASMAQFDGFYNAELKLSGLASGKKTTTDLTYGIGGQYDFNRNLGLRLEWNRYSGVKAPDVAGRSSSDTDIDVLSVGALWRF